MIYSLSLVAETNLLFPWANLEVYAIYIDENNELNTSKVCTVAKIKFYQLKSSLLLIALFFIKTTIRFPPSAKILIK